MRRRLAHRDRVPGLAHTEMPVGRGQARTYTDLRDAAEDATLNGGSVLVAGLDDIIASRRHANRGKDHEPCRSWTGSLAANTATSTSTWTTTAWTSEKPRRSR